MRSALLLFLFLCLSAPPFFAVTNGAVAHPLAVSASLGPELLVQTSTLVGFNTYEAVELRFTDHFSFCFYSRYFYVYMTNEVLRTEYQIDHYSDSSVSFGLELQFYPFSGFFRYLFAGIAGYAEFRSISFNDREIYPLFSFSFNTRIGYKWIVFGNEGLFIQPSVNCIFPLNQYPNAVPYVEMQKLRVSFYFLLEVGLVL